jgi:DNA helicase-2/ATP-dependent DNA helicase PcrA
LNDFSKWNSKGKNNAYDWNTSGGFSKGSGASGDFAPKVKLYGGRNYTGKKINR